LVDNPYGAWGAVARAHDGSVVFSVWGMTTHCQSVKMAGAIACLEGLKLVVNYTHGNLKPENISIKLVHVSRKVNVVARNLA
jgi:hypothetical protein